MSIRLISNKLIKLFSLVVVASMLFGAPVALAESGYAGPERMAAATGHYARARAMLVEALAEFDHAMSIASPDLLLDSEEWRLSVISRAEDLNRLLDPKPRVSRQGVRFSTDALQAQHSRRRPASPHSAPQTSNTVGEEEFRAKEKARKIREIAERNQRSASATPILEQVNPENQALPEEEDYLANQDFSGAEAPKEQTVLNKAPAKNLGNESGVEATAHKVAKPEQELDLEMEKTLDAMLKERMLKIQREQLGNNQ